MSSEHPYHRLPIPPDAPFELRPSPGKKYGAFATRTIEKNSLILRDKPLFIIKQPTAKITEAKIRHALRKLPADKKKQFLSIRDNGSAGFKTFLDAFFQDSLHTPQPDGTEAHGPHVLLSRFNHSCIPNARIPSPKDESSSMLAKRDIAAGEEITIQGIPFSQAWTSSERRKSMRFECDCWACVPGTAYQLLSDLRRRLIRGFYYLVTGIDDGPENSDPNGPISDPKLRKAADTFTTPSTSRFVHGLLFYALLEAEGLLHDDHRGLVVDITVTTGMSFETESNIRIADVIGKQETRFQKFFVAAEMYGRPDAGDEMTSMILRLKYGPMKRVQVPRVGII